MRFRPATSLLVAAFMVLLVGCATVPTAEQLYRSSAAQHGNRAAVLCAVPDLPRRSGSEEGAAALTDVALYWHKALAYSNAVASLRKYKGVLSVEEAVIPVADAQGLWSFSLYGTADVLREKVRHGVPVVVMLQDWSNADSRRFSVVVGFDDVAQQYLCNDGAGSPAIYAYDDFARRWMPTRNWMAVICPPDQVNWAMTESDYLARARFYETRGDWESAKRDYERALALAPSSVDAKRGLATAFQRLRDFSRAAALFREIIQKNPQDDRAANNLAFVLAQSRQSLDEAERLAREVVQREPTNPAALDTLGYVLLQRKDFTDAIPFLESAYEHAQGLDPKAQREIAMHLALAYLGDRRVQMMQKIISSILDSDPDFHLPDELKKTFPAP